MKKHTHIFIIIERLDITKMETLFKWISTFNASPSKIPTSFPAEIDKLTHGNSKDPE